MAIIALLRPSATEGQSGFTANSGTLVTAIDPGDSITHDDDTTWGGMNTDAGAAFLWTTMTGFPNSGSVAAINSITGNLRARVTANDNGGAGAVTIFNRRASSSGATSSVADPFLSLTYVDSGPHTLSRAGGGSYLPTDLDAALGIGVGVAGSAQVGASWLMTSLWGHISYDLKSGAQVIFAAQLAALGLLGGYLDLVQLMQALRRIDIVHAGIDELRLIREAL